ncbi:DUF4188 domain-containing protein [Thalassiella azotivora]
MAKVVPGRRSADDGAVVVFLIGMRVNRWWALRSWWPVASAMPRMLRELASDPSSGLLAYRLAVGPGGPLVVQYWRSADDLLDYALDAGREHRPAWKAFNERARSSRGAVGIWHETYAVPAGAHESVYVDVPAAGLAAAVGSVPTARRGDSARERLARRAA